MASVHVFLSTGRFTSFADIRAYVDERYTDDGDGIPSEFMTEVGLSEYEPGCIEAVWSVSGEPVPVRELLREASYVEQWLHGVDEERTGDAALCVYSPNVLATPHAASMQCLGEFAYAV